jgi:hypothetical protein
MCIQWLKSAGRWANKREPKIGEYVNTDMKGYIEEPVESRGILGVARHLSEFSEGQVETEVCNADLTIVMSNYECERTRCDSVRRGLFQSTNDDEEQ